MARTKGTYTISANIEPEAAAPLDARMRVATKADLTASGSFPYPWIGMKCYVTEEDKEYQLKATPPTSLSNWEKVVDSADLEDTAKQINDNIATGNNAYTNLIIELIGKIANIEDNLKNDKYTVFDTAVFTSGSFGRDFLPEHTRLMFCTQIELSYTATFAAAGNEVLTLNNKAINVPVESGEQTVSIKIVCEGLSTKIYSSGILISQNNDSIILSVGITSADTSLTQSDVFKYAYSYVPYAEVNVAYPYPVYEKRPSGNTPGSIFYGTKKWTSKNNESAWNNDYIAMYQLGENMTGFNQGCYAQTWETQMEHIYMANWDFSHFVAWNNVFEWTNTDFAIRGLNRPYRFDFSKVNLKNMANPPYNFCFFPRFTGAATYGSIINALEWKNIKRFYAPQQFLTESFGDLSAVDISGLTSLSNLFYWDMNLKYVGDIGKWKLTDKITALGGIFRHCYNLRGISKEIGNWDTSNVTTLSGAFQNAMFMGDETLSLLGNWDTGNVTQMVITFGYGEIPDQSDFTYVYINNIGPLPGIQEKRTDLSFIENWDVHSCTTFQAFAQNNPYLVNIGDLRNWDTTALTDIDCFLLNCTALETFKMPNIPNGANVTDMVKGCTSLANIELNALNVAAISFEDCPLTKQSVLNLINAATADTSITLKQSVYDAYASDSDVMAAIASKASSSITVSLVRAA